MTDAYTKAHAAALNSPEQFWTEAAAGIDWDEPWQTVLDQSGAPFSKWFDGGHLNVCHNALDRHVDNGRADQLALIYDSPVTDTVLRFTYRELRDQVALFAGQHLLDVRRVDDHSITLLLTGIGGGWAASRATCTAQWNEDGV